MKRLVRNEKGQALVLTLLLLLIGSLIIAPTLSLMGTGIRSGRVYEQKNDEIYAADAGIEDAMWHIRNNNPDNDDLLREVLGVNYNPYDYSTAYPYTYLLSVNDKDVAINISNVWIPTGISTPDAATAKQIIDDEKLMIVGYPDATASTYDIKIVYYWQGSNALNVKTLGIWLSSSFEYSEYSGSCSLQGQTWYRAPTISLDKGGCAVVWSFASPYPLLSSFPTPATGSTPPLVKIFTFKYTGPQGQIPELVACWIDTTGVPGTTYSCSWDDSIRLHKIVSQAGGVQIDAYGAKSKFRRLKTAISGDYFGTGNTLIGGNLNPPDNYHYQLYRSTPATVATNDNDDTLGIPSDATVEAAYLYWTGWIDWNTYNPPDSGSQTAYPTGDISRSGTWDKTTDMYSYVDEQGTNDGDSTYLLHGTTSGNVLFNFPAFTVPRGMAIAGLTVSLVARDYNCSYFCSNNMRPAVKVGGNTYYGTSTEVPTNYGTISYTWATNPRTGNAWTIDDINGVGSYALQGFGVYSSDASPQIRLTQVYARVSWGSTLRYWPSYTDEDKRVLVEDTARVNKVYFKGGSSADNLVTTHDWQILYPPEYDGTDRAGTWFYTCKADVTSLLEAWIGNGTIASNGAGSYTFSHVAAPNEADPTYSFSFYSGGGSTGYPVGTPSPNPPGDTKFTTCHAGWSLLILYSSAKVYNHQFYLYDIDTPGFTFFTGRNNNADFDNDGSDGGTISGFLVPPQIPGEANAARITVFVGEGDKGTGYTDDRFKVNLTSLPDGTGLPDVWNSNSRGLTVEGIDIDHFYVTWASGILKPMDVSAKIDIPTGIDRFTMAYMLFMFRSMLGVGGVITNYAIRII